MLSQRKGRKESHAVDELKYRERAAEDLGAMLVAEFLEMAQTAIAEKRSL